MIHITVISYAGNFIFQDKKEPQMYDLRIYVKVTTGRFFV